MSSTRLSRETSGNPDPATLTEALTQSIASQRPRICMVSTHGYVAAEPPLGAADTGGQVVYVLELSKKLAELGYEVDIWTRRFEDQPEFDMVAEGVRVIRVGCGGKDFIPKEYLYKRLPEWCENALRVMRRHDLRYAFINSHYWDAGYAGLTLAKQLAVPHVFTPHSIGQWKLGQMRTDYPDGEIAFEKKYNFKERIRNENIIFRECDTIISTTPVQTDQLIKDYGIGKGRIRMIPPGYDDTKYFPVSYASRQVVRENLGWSGPTILALGRLASNKGYDLLVHAFKLVADRYENARLHLAMGGEDMDPNEQKLFDEINRIAREDGTIDRITFGGFIPDEEMADYYRAADLFVLCSRYEPFGMTAVEAMASGTPTVVTCHGGLWRALIYGRHALIADPFDTEDLGVTMCKVFQFPKMAARMRSRGARRARAMFTWTGIAQQLIRTVEQRTSRTFKTPDLAWDDEEDWLD
ncbi:MAG: glycosyltransferase [Planctomycetota bacterium]